MRELETKNRIKFKTGGTRTVWVGIKTTSGMNQNRNNSSRLSPLGGGVKMTRRLKMI